MFKYNIEKWEEFSQSWYTIFSHNSYEIIYHQLEDFNKMYPNLHFRLVEVLELI